MARRSVAGLIGALLVWTACSDSGPDREDRSPGTDEVADGQFSLHQIRTPRSGSRRAWAAGSIMEPRPRYQRLEKEEGACRLWTWDVAWCEGCEYPEGLCNDEGECVESFPRTLSAGPISVSVDGEQVLDMFFIAGQGYLGGYMLPDGLFGAGDRLTLEAAGGPDVSGFSLGGRMLEPAMIDLERLPGRDYDGAVVLRDGQDRTISWSPVVDGSRVRIELPTNNRGHGSPPDALIECEAFDDGSIVVPRSIVEAFPEEEDRGEGTPCPGSTDCPAATVTRYVTDRVDVDGLTIELEVGARYTFSVIHPR